MERHPLVRGTAHHLDSVPQSTRGRGDRYPAKKTVQQNAGLGCTRLQVGFGQVSQGRTVNHVGQVCEMCHDASRFHKALPTTTSSWPGLISQVRRWRQGQEHFPPVDRSVMGWLHRECRPKMPQWPWYSILHSWWTMTGSDTFRRLCSAITMAGQAPRAAYSPRSLGAASCNFPSLTRYPKGHTTTGGKHQRPAPGGRAIKDTTSLPKFTECADRPEPRSL